MHTKDLVVTFIYGLALCGYVQTLSYNVKNYKEFQNALAKVKPGDKINLARGTYRGSLTASRSGTRSKPIVIQGPQDAIVTHRSYGFHITGSHWHLKGFTVANSLKGIVIDYGCCNKLERLRVHDIEDEGIHVRHFSTDNLIVNSTVYNTGLVRPGFGEGIYIGQSRGKWVNNKPDRCDRNKIIGNTIGPNCGGEGVDIKEGTCCGVISGNYFDGHGLSNVNSDDSWVDMKGDSYIIEDNKGYWTLKDGFQIHDRWPPGLGIVGGCNNTFRRNHCDLRTKGYCIYSANVKKCANFQYKNTLSNGDALDVPANEEAEGVGIKEPTRRGLISGNHFEAYGLSTRNSRN